MRRPRQGRASAGLGPPLSPRTCWGLLMLAVGSVVAVYLLALLRTLRLSDEDLRDLTTSIDPISDAQLGILIRGRGTIGPAAGNGLAGGEARMPPGARPEPRLPKPFLDPVVPPAGLLDGWDETHGSGAQAVRATNPEMGGAEGGAASSSSSSDMHVVFSTDCSPYQNWQSILLFYSSLAVGQPGLLTRIASGCSEMEVAALRTMHAHMPPHFRVHFTPDFSFDKATGKKYYFYNKPFGLLHWLDHGNVDPDTIVALVDPDMLFMAPLTGFYPSGSYLATSPWKQQGEVWSKVEKGKPAGQQYGLGDRWRRFNREYICGAGSPCTTIDSLTAHKYFPVGPPYIAHVSDMRQIAAKWVEFVPKIYEEYPQLLAEMYAYCMAAAHLGLRHARLDHHMVSNTGAGGEGWPWVDSMGDDVCLHPKAYRGKLPTVLHYCQNYRLGDWMFAKRRVPKGEVGWPATSGMLSCDAPLFQEPDASITSLRFYNTQNGETKSVSQKQSRRLSFVLCAVTRQANDALTAFKRDVCPGGGNLTKSVRLLSKQEEDRQAKEKATARARGRRRAS